MTGLSDELVPFPDDLYQQTHKEQTNNGDDYKRKGSGYLLIAKIIMSVYYIYLYINVHVFI